MQINGVDLLTVPARDVYSYGLALMDCFFTKEELAKSLCFKSKKSEKPPLDHAKMEKLLGKHVLYFFSVAVITYGNSLYVTVHGKRAHSPQNLFMELYISRECTMRALRDDANCSKIAYSVLELYTEIYELRKTH